jgi:hypothetical protein
MAESVVESDCRSREETVGGTPKTSPGMEVVRSTLMLNRLIRKRKLQSELISGPRQDEFVIGWFIIFHGLAPFH